MSVGRSGDRAGDTRELTTNSVTGCWRYLKPQVSSSDGTEVS